MEWAWYDSPGFNRFRGDAWMKEPCRSCPEKEQDLGGCRCQAYMLTGNAAAADPVCDKSPEHGRVLEAVSRGTSRVEEKPIVFRTDRESRRLMRERGTSVEIDRLFEPEACVSADNTRVGR